jgi:hypothetical protein
MKKKLTLADRAAMYAEAFPQYPDSHLNVGADGNRIYGMWFGGQNYRGSGYYGAYPHGYLKRVNSMFTDCNPVLHLFSGSLPAGNYTRVDINEDNGAEVVCDAHELSESFPANTFEVIYADPPYTDEDATKYGTAPCNRNRVVKECNKILKPGGFLVWLDQVFPMFRKDELHLVGSIGFVRSTNHRFRVVTIFRKAV